MALRLSVLDQSPIAEGGTGGQALRNSVDLARLTDALGYSRYWVAEHHGMPMLASTAPEILIAEIAAVTERIRVGSGGVMLPHYSPFKVAETFSILGGLHGDRIDLGIGRAPGSDRETMFALQRDRRQMSPDDFPEQLPSCSRTSRTTSRTTTSSRGSPPCRARRESPTSGCSAPRRRARSGPASWGSRTPWPTSSTRAARRSPGSIASASSRHGGERSPSSSVCVAAICADTDAEARRLAASTHMTITLLRRGRLIAVPTVEKALAFFEQPGESMAASGGESSSARRRPSEPGWRPSPQDYGAGEVLVVTITYDHAARRRSYELLAQAFELTP